MGDEKYKAKIEKSLALEHYNQPHVIDAMLACAFGKEVVGSFGGTGYARRPDTIRYKSDIIEQVKTGVTSFHISEETWVNPFILKPGMSQEEMNRVRNGWDLIIDIDCAFLEYSKIAADLLIQALEHEGISSITCKFSGNHGFHIAVPFEAFPKYIKNQAIESLFPEAAKVIAEYLKHSIEPNEYSSLSLSSFIINYEKKQNGLQQSIPDDIVLPYIQEKTQLPFDSLVKQDSKGQLFFDAFNILEIDTLLISSRHLVRHVYSINEKSGLVSIPINPKKVLDFNADVAKIENFIQSKFGFLDRETANENEAESLFQRAYEWKNTRKSLVIGEEKEQRQKQTTNRKISKPIPEEMFPDCIKKILAGINDGRKRAVFVLLNFLGSVGWSYEQIEQRVLVWNKQNASPLKEVYIYGQLKSMNMEKIMLPPNCNNAGYYDAMGVACQKCTAKNPVNAAIRRYFSSDEGKKLLTKNNNTADTLTPEQKEKIKAHQEKQKKQIENKEKNDQQEQHEIIL